ncbi:unnamed protein product [Effrenium voratum]|uniref:Uncharacterized protein n=1 Tax=Effrenium voratum TaxID=2562239 RepID=A0AA36JLK3_9DINO|nr:unnamed protein product [Effrenium voratum]
MAAVVREARQTADDPLLVRRFRSGSHPPRQLAPLAPLAEPEPSVSPRRGGRPKVPRAQMRPRSPKSAPPARELCKCAVDEAAEVLHDLEAFGATLQDQSSVVSGLAEKEAELAAFLEASRNEASALRRALESLEQSEAPEAPEGEDEMTRAREALGLE